MLETYQCKLCGKKFVRLSARDPEEENKCPSCGSKLLALYKPAPAKNSCSTFLPGRFRVG